MKLELTIPNKMSDIKLKDFIKYNAILENNKDNIQFMNYKCVEIFCGVKMRDVMGIRANDFDNVLSDIYKALSEETRFKRTFEYGGVKYGFIPKLDDISMAEYVDLENYLQDFKTFNKAMAVMYRPITFEKNGMYIIEEYKGARDYEDVMKETSLDIFLGAKVFFYNLGKDLLKAIPTFLTQNQTGLDSHQKRILADVGVGIRAFTHSLEETLPSSTRLQKKESMSV